MKKRILSILLVAVLLFSMIPLSSMTAFAENNITEYWTDEGNYDISWYDGSHYYTLKDAADLAGLAVLVNGLNGNKALDFTYQLDMGSFTIPLTETISIENEIDLSGKLWTPIGTSEHPFSGTFCGNYKVIKNMIVRTTTTFAGLFGYAETLNGASASIREVNVTDSNVSATDSAMYIGGVVGCFKSGNLLNCSYEGTVSAEDCFVGGIIGQPEYTNVHNCVNYATVTATKKGSLYIGGIAGDNMGYIERCANFGKVSGYNQVGGIAGTVSVSYGRIKNCYNVGNVTATESYVGSIAAYGVTTAIENCYYLKGTAVKGLYSFPKTCPQPIETEKSNFSSGEVAYKLNGEINGGTNFYQNLDNGKTVDVYPLPNSNHGKVYKTTKYTKCDKSDTPTVIYSNTDKGDDVPNHVYQYSASDNVITETCKNCKSHTETATITINSSNEFEYDTDKEHKPATVTYSNGWCGGTLTVQYENNVNAGTDTAKAYIEKDNAKAIAKFSIKKATNTWTTEPSISDWTYGEPAKAPVYGAKFGTVNITYTGTTNSGSDYNSTDAPTEAGNYTAIFKVDGNDNYTKLEKSVDFKIDRANRLPTSVVSGINETIDGKSDGKITGVSDLMEYRKNGEQNYTAINGTEITNLEAGKYYVRFKETDNYNASNDYEIDIATGKKLKVTVPTTQTGYTLTVNNSALKWNESTTITFVLKEGYSELQNFAVKVNGETITLDNDGKYIATNVQSDITVAVEGVADITAPETEITLGTNKWNKFFNDITFGLFFKDTQKVTVTASDKGSGLDKVYYYLSATELNEGQVKALTDWKEYNGEFNINPQDEYIIYVKASDKDGNTRYVSSEKGIVVDSIAPVISGIANGKTHYGDTTFTVTDKHIDIVKVDGKPVTLTEGKYTITADGKEHTVVATDKSGNSSEEIKITVITIASLDDSIENITEDNVKSSDKKAIEDVQSFVNGLITGGKDFTDAEDTQLTDIKANTENLLKKIDNIAKEIKDITDSVNAYENEKVKSDDKQDIEDLIDRIDSLNNTENVTETEKTALEEVKSTADDLIKKIDDIASDVKDLTDTVNGYDKDKVTSDDKKNIEDLITEIDKLLDGDNLNDSEKEELGKVKDTANGLVDKINEAADSSKTENTDKVKDTTADNVKTEDKKDLENAKQDLEKALTDYSDNLTESEKKDIQDKINSIENALKVIDKVEKVEDLINNLPNDITKGDADTIKTVNDVYNALTEYEKSILDNNLKKKLDSAKTTLERLNSDTSANSPKTEDIANALPWIAVFAVSGMLTYVLICLKKRTKIKK